MLNIFFGIGMILMIIGGGGVIICSILKRYVDKQITSDLPENINEDRLNNFASDVVHGFINNAYENGVLKPSQEIMAGYFPIIFKMSQKYNIDLSNPVVYDLIRKKLEVAFSLLAQACKKKILKTKIENFFTRIFRFLKIH